MNLSVFVDICQPLTLLRLLYKNPDKNVRFCAFILLTAMEQKVSLSLVLILSQCFGRDKYPCLCVHTDLLQSKTTSVYVNIHFERRFCKPPLLRVFVRSSVNGLTKTDI